MGRLINWNNSYIYAIGLTILTKTARCLLFNVIEFHFWFMFGANCKFALLQSFGKLINKGLE